MILQALQIMLFGMLGIFIVMGVIIAAITILNKVTGKKKPVEEKPHQGQIMD